MLIEKLFEDSRELTDEVRLGILKKSSDKFTEDNIVNIFFKFIEEDSDVAIENKFIGVLRNEIEELIVEIYTKFLMDFSKEELVEILNAKLQYGTFNLEAETNYKYRIEFLKELILENNMDKTYIYEKILNFYNECLNTFISSN